MLQGFIVAAGVALTLIAPQAGRQAANFPSRPVKIVVLHPAGGAADVLMRVMAPVLQDQWACRR